MQHFPMAIEMLKNKSKTGPIAVWAITPNGKMLGQKIRDALKDAVLFVSAKMEDDTLNKKTTVIFKKLSKEIHLQFNQFSGHVFIFSTGIAVRIIAPVLNSKTIDPAVVVIDDNGNHAISLLSGHMGGANALAKKVAAIINAVPVITTATDTNRVPSIDLIAKGKGLYIETPQNIKHINMAFLMGDPVDLYDPFRFIEDDLPEPFWTKSIDMDKLAEKIFCSYEINSVSRETLILRPPVLSVGIGCNRGTGVEEIKDFLISTLNNEGLSINSLYRFATITLKQDEKGLLELSEKMNLPIDFHTREELNSVTTIQTPSNMVEKHLGVKSVCEAAAILSAGNGKLIVPKKKTKDVTIAVAIKK